MPPPFLVDFVFFGRSCGAGVNPTMRDRLSAVADRLQEDFSALPPEEVNPSTGQPWSSVDEWVGLKEPLIGWRPHSGFHSSGSGVDINATTNAYIVTRTGATIGGERAGGSFTAMRQAAVSVFDRAVEFFIGTDNSADLSIRRPSETTADVYDRFERVSSAVVYYLAYAFHSDSGRVVNRVPIADVEAVARETLDGIPIGERRDKQEAIAFIETTLSDGDFISSHPNWPLSAEDQYYRMLRDYELVRIPMVIGNPSLAPARTRNPARGILDLRKELVVALCDVGRLRWGACDFGAAESGDLQHFDLGNDGGFQRVDD